MTKYPFNDINDAFLPFFDNTIAIKGIRPDNQEIFTSLQASIFPVEDVDPFSDSDIETDLKKIEILVDTIYFGKIQVGDEITTEYNEKYKVTKVEKTLDFTKISARSIWILW